jgi:hypothetical protein
MEEKKKVWIRGRKGRGSEIKKILKGLGAKVYGLDCNEDDSIYFIDHENGIGVTFTDSELAQVIMDNYREIELPRQEWKDGDVLLCDGSHVVLNDQHVELKADKVKREGTIGKRSYYAFPNGVEAEDICRYLSFNLGNVVKYSCRAGRKDATKKIEDLEKAKDYLENEIKRVKEELDNEIEGMKEKIAKENEGR